MTRRSTAALVIVAAASSALLTACLGGGNGPSKDLLDLINEKRVAAGCPTIAGDEHLRVAAERHAVDIQDHPDHFGAPGTPPLRDLHAGTDGSNPGTRIDDAGYRPKSRWGEIVYTASGGPYNTAQATIDWWMKSPPHKANIENCAFSNAGAGLLYRSEVQWIAVVDFATH
jgi:uncharacterized protein YkwD